MIITYKGLVDLVEQGVIENVPIENINGASIDITLQDGYWYENCSKDGQPVIDLGQKQTPSMIYEYGDLLLRPGEFALAATEQVFNLPNDVAAVYVLKSSLARAGLQHMNAGYCDPGWTGSALTLEFKNVLRRHALKLSPGDKAGQMYFFRGGMVPVEFSYATRGQYNNDRISQPSKGSR